jgi:phage-related protein (TIGR01555 family)
MPKIERKRMPPGFNFDSWENELTGLGVLDRDKRMSSAIAASPVLNMAQLDNLYRFDFLPKKICNLPAKEMTREGIEITQTDQVTPEVIEKINKKMKGLKLWKSIRRALQWCRLYGGGAIPMIIEDGGNSWDPVNVKTIKRIRGVYDLNATQIYPIEYQQVLDEPDYGEPIIYQLMPSSTVSLVTNQNLPDPITRWHRSRLMIFDGVDLPEHLRLQNQGWGDSLFQAMYNELRNYHQGVDGAASLVSDFSQAVFKIKGLHAKVAANSGGVVSRRMALVNLARSMIGATIIDADGEDFERKATPVTGLPDLLDKFERVVVAVSDMPHTVLFGDSPSGLGATGEHEEKVWKDNIKSMQEDKLRTELDKYLEYYSASTESGLKGMEIVYEFKSLFQQSEKEQAEIRKLISETDKNNIQFGIYSKDEARTRYEGDGFTIDISLDEDTQREFEEVEEIDEPEDDLEKDEEIAS